MKELTDEQYAEVVEALKENAELRKQVTEYRTDLADLKDLILKFLAIIGFSDGTRLIPGVLLPEDHDAHVSPMGVMFKAISDMGQLMVGAKFSKSAEKRLEEKFAFIKKYTPLILKYGNE